MRRSWVTPGDRARSIAGVVAIHAAIVAALLTLGPAASVSDPQSERLETFDVVPYAPQPVVDPEPLPERASEEEGEAAPPAQKAEATPVVAPPPIVAPPTPPAVAAKEPGEGAQPTQGAAPTPGPGTGAGGVGAGLGSGGAGTGPGGGGGGGQRPALVSRSLTARDFSRESRRAWPSGKRVLVIFNVQIDGRATDCRVFRSIGVPGIDAETCRLVTTRLRFRPARDERGVPYVERYAYEQYALF